MKVAIVEIPRLLREARRETGITQAELGRRLGISQAAVAKLERPGANPTVQTLDRAMWAMGRSVRLEALPRGPGVDESLIRRQLELTPAERIAGLEVMFKQMQVLSRAGASSRGEQS